MIGSAMTVQAAFLPVNDVSMAIADMRSQSNSHAKEAKSLMVLTC
jgi:hypothetical protein